MVASTNQENLEKQPVNFTDILERPGFYGNSPDLDDRSAVYTDINTPSEEASPGANNNRVLVEKAQYKIPHKAYKGIDEEGRPFETFSLDTQQKNSCFFSFQTQFLRP
jgi:hypothetical protein